MSELALKACVPVALVGLASLAGRRWGDTAAGLVGGLPVVAGPILFFMAREQGPAFAAGAATLTVLSIVSLSLFLLAFAWRAWVGAPALSCLGLGWVVFLASTLVLDRVSVAHPTGLFKALAYALAALFLARRSLPRGADTPGARAGAPNPWDLPLRLASAALLVLTLTALARQLGARLGGLLTAFPVASSVLSAFAYLQGGREAARAVIKGLLLALNAYAVFCCVLALALPAWGLGAGFTAATLAAAAAQALILRLGPPLSGLRAARP